MDDGLGKKCVLFANSDWYLYNFRMSTMVALRKKGYEVLLLSPDGPYAQRLVHSGFRHMAVPLVRRSLNPLCEIYLLAWLWRLFRRERPTVVHGFTIKCAIYACLVARLARVPRSIAAIAGLGHVYSDQSLRSRMLCWLVGRLMACSFRGEQSTVVVQNDDDANELLGARIVPPSKMRVIRGSGVDVRRFSAPRGRVTRPRPLKVLFASRLLWSKGLGEYAEASLILRRSGVRMQCFLAGSVDPENPASCKEADIRRWEEQGALRWLGHQADMPALLADMDVMVLPSYYREGVPRCLLEAAASGLAIITTNMPGCRDVVSCPGHNGLVIPPRHAEALARSLAALDADRLLCLRLGRNARRHVARNFDERSVVAQTLALYTSLS